MFFDDAARAKRELAHALKTRMRDRGWTQSELARRSGLPRDSISTYVLEKTLPGPRARESLARALDCTVADLVTMPDASPPIGPSLVLVEDDPTRAHLRVDQIVPTDLGMRVFDLLRGKQET